jgi:hypothetical protein
VWSAYRTICRPIWGDRGAIREQAPGDIVIYDLDKLEVLPSEVAEDLPGGKWRRIQKSKGYDWILVNGQITFEDGEPTGRRWPLWMPAFADIRKKARRRRLNGPLGSVSKNDRILASRIQFTLRVSIATSNASSAISRHTSRNSAGGL